MYSRKNTRAHGQNEFKSILRKAGSRATPARMRVLEFMKKSRNPVSAAEVIEALGARMDQATVYRILSILKSKGTIRQVDLRHNHAHFEIAGEREHHHLICLACGRMEDVHECRIEEAYPAVLRAARHFSDIRQHALEFYGLCRACARDERSGNSVSSRHETAPL